MEAVASQITETSPVSLQHGLMGTTHSGPSMSVCTLKFRLLSHLVGHHAEERTSLGEVINGLLEVSEGLQLLRRLGQFPDPEEDK